MDEEHVVLSRTVRDLLGESAVAALNSLGRRGGFLDNPKVRVPLPGVLEDAKSLVVGMGLSTQADGIERSFNRVAEAVAASALPIVQDSIAMLTIDDARALMVGAPDAASRYLRRVQGASIAEQLLPITREKLVARDETRLLPELVDLVAGRLPGANELRDLDLAVHITRYVIEGLFHRMGEEEKIIREGP